MPLPWKKAGISRISRFMADLHPTKPPCFSMVVQTGFPTSLVDLFVKNCDRLKKPIKNKKKKRFLLHHHQSPAVHDFSGEEEEKDYCSVDLNNTHKVDFDSKNKSVGRFESDDEDVSRGGFDNRTTTDQRGVLYVVLMVFVVAVLALISIKILTLGITMSACVLIFVEYIGKQIFRLSLCSNFVRFKAAFCVFLCKEDDKREEAITESKEEEREDEQEDEEEEEDDDEEEYSIELNSPVEEIEAAEARCDAVARPELDNDGTGMNLSPGRWGYSGIEIEEEEDECECEVTAPEKQHSRHRRSSKEFMKKLVPKKWRAMKKARKGRKEITEEYASSELSSSSHSSEDNKLTATRNEEIEEQLYNNNSSESKGRITFLIEEEESSKMSLENAVKFEKSYKEEEEEEEEVMIKKERKKSQRSSALMLLVALAGLVGGRIIALGLTVISCVIIQLVTARRGRNPKAMC